MTPRLMLRLVLTLPPHVTVRKAIALCRRGVTNSLARRRDQRHSTYASLPFEPTLATGHFQPPPLQALRAQAEVLRALAEAARAHTFDLLGSGPVTVRHGMSCAGVEGHRYAAEAVLPDAAGRWLESRLPPACVADAKRAWALLPENYVPIDWHLDFKSGYRWSEATWFQDVRYGHLPGVDVKVPWELARMQHLPTLAWAYGLARAHEPGFAAAEAYAGEFRAQVLDFIATNPPRFGPNWACPMDVAIRVANWLVARDMFRGLGACFDAPFERQLAEAVYQHGRHVLHHLEWNPDIRGNHYLSDVVGLLFAAAYLPRAPETDAWLAFSVQELVAEVETQFHPDGSNFEAATAYHRLSAELVTYATALVLGLSDERLAALDAYDHRLHRVQPPLRPAPLPRFATGGARSTPFAPSYLAKLARMAEFAIDMTKPSGAIPQLGDNDSGRFLKLQPVGHLGESGWEEDPLDLRHLVAAIDGLFDRAAFGRFANERHFERGIVKRLARGRRLDFPAGPGAAGLRVGTPEALEAEWRRLAALPASHRQVIELSFPPGALDGLSALGYPDFGLYVLRSPRLYMAVRCGPIGQNGLGGHAHNDQLHLELAVDGEDWIRDPGTYMYTPLPARRREYRSVRAHFAPRVGDLEPGNLTLGAFCLGDEARAECLFFGPAGFLGRHVGYGAPILRAIRLTPGGLCVLDASEGAPLSPLPHPLSPEWPASQPVFSPGYGLRAATPAAARTEAPR